MKGGIKDGGGTISTETGFKGGALWIQGALQNGWGTNPEELIGAAHAGCFSMALPLMLGKAGLTPEKIEPCRRYAGKKIGAGFNYREPPYVSAKFRANNAKFQEIANTPRGFRVEAAERRDLMDAKLGERRGRGTNDSDCRDKHRPDLRVRVQLPLN
jgi:osmotically inducible protein OsmC